ncbi:MAG: hypothetical protein AAB922_03495 [Patescibacteria group bacterium]
MTLEEAEQAVNNLQNQIDELKEALPLSYRQKLRLDNALQDEKTYYVVPGATGPTGPSTIKLTFKDGVLTSEV